MHGTIHRPATVQRVRLGAEKDGRLNAFSFITWTHCERNGNFTEHASNFARALYASPNRLTGHRLVKLDLPMAGPMRAPGEASGTLSLECAMDELAEQLGLDPVELRIRNEPAVDPENGRPFSQRQLVRCLREGAQLFGWDRRNATPGQVRDGRWLVGMGMAAAIRGNFLLPAKCSFSVDADGVITVRQGMTDIGTGTYTVLAQIAAETLGVPLGDVRVEIGDSELPPAPGSGGQFGAATAGSAALHAGMNMRKAIAELAVNDPGSPLQGGDAEAVTFQDGVVAIGNRSETLAELVRRAAPEGLVAEGEIRPAQDANRWSTQTYGAHFVEVGVDPVTGETRVRRMLGVFAAGRIINAKTARSQLTGGMIWGIASALHEGNAVDPRYGSLINQDLAQYILPVQADIGDLDAIMLDEVDDKANPMGIKGVGELGNSGAGAAVANAIYNACGVRVRDYPITPDKLLAGLIAAGL
jgi:xanthine dehydrogenase YagR molybdenum-binding subunit